MSELDTPAATQEELDILLNPEFMSPRERKIIEALDQKNVDRDDLKTLFSSFLTTYQNTMNSGSDTSE